MVHPPQPFTQPENHAPRFDDQALAKIDQTLLATPRVLPGPFPKLTWPLITYPIDKDERSRVWDVMPLEYAADRRTLEMRVRARIGAFLRTEGAVARLLAGWGTSAGVIDDRATTAPTKTTLRCRHRRWPCSPSRSGRIHRLVERAVPVRLEIAVDAQFYPKAQGINVIAEFRGQSARWRVRECRAHLTPGMALLARPTTVPAARVVMEVMRISRCSILRLARGVRAALWSGRDNACAARVPRQAALRRSGDDAAETGARTALTYFNLDNGAGRIRGVYLQGNDMARPMFEASWFAPLAELGVTLATRWRTRSAPITCR